MLRVPAKAGNQFRPGPLGQIRDVGDGHFRTSFLPTRSVGRGTSRRLVEGKFRRSCLFPSTTLRAVPLPIPRWRSEEHTSELQSLMRISYAVFCLQKKRTHSHIHKQTNT